MANAFIMTIAFILNSVIPGLGNIVIGRWVQGFIQLLTTLAAFVLVVSVFLVFFGLVLFGLSWIYALAVWTYHLRTRAM